MFLLVNEHRIIPYNLTLTKSLDIKNNKGTFTAPKDYYSVIDTNDEVILYVNGNELMKGYITEKSFTNDGTQRTLSFSFVDKLSLITNRLGYASHVSIDEKSTAPLIIGNLIGVLTNDLKGVKFSRVNIKFVGYPRTDGIQVTITDHPEIEFTLEDMETNSAAWQSYVALPDTDKFKKIDYGSYQRPAYEMIKELLQENNTGIKKDFVFTIDVNDNILLYQTDSQAPTNISLFPPYSITTKQESEINYLIIYCGNDLNGAQIYTYAYKDYSGTPNIQESFKNWSDIARDLKPYYTDNNAFRQAVIDKARDRAIEFFNQMTEGVTRIKFTEYNNISYNVGKKLNLTTEFGDSYPCKLEKIGITFDRTRGLVANYELKELVS